MSAIPALGHGPADEIVHPPVEILDDVAMLNRNFLGAGGMVLVEIAPKHVLHAIRAVKDAHANAPLDFVETVEKHRLAFPVEVEALLQKLLIAQERAR